METFLTILLFVVGLALIIKGGDFFVDASTWIAETFRIPKFIIGATIVSLATTLPELLVSAIAAANGSVDMAIGNAVGSVTANIGLIMGISIVCIPAVMRRKDLFAKGLLMVGAALTVFLFSLGKSFILWASLPLLAIFAYFIYENIHEAKRARLLEAPSESEETALVKPQGKTIALNVIKFLLGAAGIVGGAQLLVDNGQKIALLLNIPESVVGVTMVAIGTSLPELVTTITAIAKKQANLSIGNILGANIIDLALILPVCQLIYGGSLPVAKQSLYLDMPMLLGVSLIAVVPTLISGKFRRWQGILLLSLYAAYMVLLCLQIVPA